MKHEIVHAPDYGLVRITFESEGETATAESGAMVAHSAGVQIKTSSGGGFLKAAKRAVLGGESLFLNTFTCTAPGQELLLAPAPEGDLRSRLLTEGEEFYLQSGSFVAHMDGNVSIDSKWGGAGGFFSGMGLFMLKMRGPGLVFFNSYGAVHEVEVGPHGYTCDTGHILGFTSGLTFDIGKFGGFKSLFLSGEGLVANFKGQGRIYLQTRNSTALAAYLERFRPVQKEMSSS